MNRVALWLLLLPLMAAGCQSAPHRTRASAATQAACRSRADEVYERQNRADLSRQDTRDAPFSSTGLPGITSEGLGARYGRDELVSSCLNEAAPGRAPGNDPSAVDEGTGPALTPHPR